MAQSIVRLWTRDTSWRQGQVLLAETAAVLNLQHPGGPDETCVVMVSHDCDIAQENLSVEPCVEIIVGRLITWSSPLFDRT
jgi:hypothetical protein